jgi:hypothetical protein
MKKLIGKMVSGALLLTTAPVVIFGGPVLFVTLLYLDTKKSKKMRADHQQNLNGFYKNKEIRNSRLTNKGTFPLPYDDADLNKIAWLHQPKKGAFIKDTYLQ